MKKRASGPRRLAATALLAGSAWLAPGIAQAQAWLPTKGEGVIGLTFGGYGFDGHFDSKGERIPYGGTEALSMSADVTYGVTDRLAVTASLPYVSSKFTGQLAPGALPGPLDSDRQYHGDFQDLRGEIRFMALTGDLALTPFVGVNLPSHNYVVEGEAVPGKRTKELALGLAAGRSLDPLLSKAYLQARYFFSFVQNVVPDVGRLNRSNIDLEFGYAVSRRLSARLISAWQIGHGGINLEQMYDNPAEWETHDRAVRTSYFNLGVGATFQAAPRVELFTAFVKTISGENAHQARSLYLGAALWFGGGYGGHARPAAQASVRPSPENVSSAQAADPH